MKHSEAEKLIRDALWCVQRSRSISNEQSEGDEALRRVQRFLEPKVHDEAYLLKPLLKLVERLDNGGKLAPIEFYNIMTVIHHWGASVQVAYIMESEGKAFPEPSIQWMRGWEPD
jgi:hypothetical protein